jgi:hypothetical protein
MNNKKNREYSICVLKRLKDIRLHMTYRMFRGGVPATARQTAQFGTTTAAYDITRGEGHSRADTDCGLDLTVCKCLYKHGTCHNFTAVAALQVLNTFPNNVRCSAAIVRFSVTYKTSLFRLINSTRSLVYF